MLSEHKPSVGVGRGRRNLSHKASLIYVSSSSRQARAA